MLKRILLSWTILAMVLAVTAYLVPDVRISGGLVGLVLTAAVFGLVNAVLGPVLRLLTLPITIVTFGLFALVVNGILLAVAAGLSDHLDVGGFLSTMLAALLVSVLSTVLHFVVARLAD